MDLTRRFSFGINLDDAWRYAGAKAPKSIIFPHLISLGLPEGRALDQVEDFVIRLHKEREPSTAAARASLALADMLSDARVDFVRCWFSWNFFEPTPCPREGLARLLDDSYPEFPMDSLVRTLSEKGIGLVPVIACGYQRMLPEGLSVDRVEYVRRAYIHARLLVRRYRGQVRFWQIENEPNWWEMHSVGGWRSGASWVESTGFREELLKALNDAVHEEDQKALTIINLEGDAKDIDAGRFAGYCDILGLDFYPNYKSSAPIDTSVFRRATEAWRETGKPVVISETGYPSGPGVLGYSEQRQAEYVQAACSEAYGLEGVSAVGIWRYTDTPWRSFPEQENHFGLMDRDGRPKPAWRGYAASIRSLADRPVTS
ncbi:MAG: hypothetical protein JRN29_03790 [Nitrososphaerota archaeon]|nr:hypothetical protein [Nitrososphaerota archaeon]